MENNEGVLIFDNKYSDVKQVDSKPFIVDEKQLEIIKSNVFDYFHVSEEIITNKASEDQWNLFYEAVIEPIAIQIGQVLTKMIIKKEDLTPSYGVYLESTKLQFISNNTKLQVSQQLFDRGLLSTNQVMDIWNLPHVEDGDKRYIRKEYTEVVNLDNGGNEDVGTKQDIGDSNETSKQKEGSESNKENDSDK